MEEFEPYEGMDGSFYATCPCVGGYVLLGPYDEPYEAFHDARAYSMNLKRVAQGLDWIMEVP